MLKVTTSWDDGDVLDKRLARLLSEYNLKGTFYITKNRKDRLSEDDIRSIAIEHEVGAHTLTHPDLRVESNFIKEKEIKGSRDWLLRVTGQVPKMFCYPKGLYDDSVIREVVMAGFIGARTTELNTITYSLPYKQKTTLQVYPFPFRKHYPRKLLQPFQQRAWGLWQLGVPPWRMYSWLSVARAAFDIALERGEVFHLWGHSWEIEKYGMWDELEELCYYISDREDCRYLTNSELIL